MDQVRPIGTPSGVELVPLRTPVLTIGKEPEWERLVPHAMDDIVEISLVVPASLESMRLVYRKACASGNRGSRGHEASTIPPTIGAPINHTIALHHQLKKVVLTAKPALPSLLDR